MSDETKLAKPDVSVAEGALIENNDKTDSAIKIVQGIVQALLGADGSAAIAKIAYDKAREMSDEEEAKRRQESDEG